MKILGLTIALIVSAAVRPAVAQDALEEAKGQYAAAAYEDALATLTRAGGTSINRVEVEQYRAFCLIALGRTVDAERAIAALVAADPTYVPSENVASPKVLSLVSDMRRKELPVIARRLFDDGRAAFKEKDAVRVQESFDLLLRILDDPAMKGRPETADLRTLAEGFVALAGAAPSPGPSAAAAAPALPAPVQPDTLVEAVTLQQALPMWTPPDTAAGAREYIGAIKIRIGADGRVKAATIERATYPPYDARMLQATRNWVYKPAQRNGQAVESEKIVAYQLRPRT